jgi:hypothetical protein
MPLWKWPWMLLIGPVMMTALLLPIQIIGSPLMLGLMLIVTILRVINLWIALGFIIFMFIWFVASFVLSAPKNEEQARYSIVDVFHIFGAASLFLFFMETIDLSPVARWFASFLLAHYITGVIVVYMSIPSTIAHELQFNAFLRHAGHDDARAKPGP